MNLLRGIDVSQWQGDIDWVKVKATGIDFAFIKATEGIGFIDPKFARNVTRAKAAGIKIGVYQFAHPENDVDQDVEYFLSVIGSVDVDVAYVLDIEQSKGITAEQVSTFADQWLTKVQQRTGKPVMIYTYPSFAKNYLNELLNKWPLWIAHYDVSAPDCCHWGEYTCWQYTQEGNVDGIGTKVDLNFMQRSFLMDKPDLKGEAVQNIVDMNSKLWFVAGEEQKKVLEYINQHLRETFADKGVK